MNSENYLMKNYIIEIRWAFIFIVATVLWAGIEKLMGLHDSKIGTMPFFFLFFAIPAVAIYVLALLEKKEKIYHGQMSWKEATVSGIVLSLFIAFLNPVAQWAIYTLISPEYFAKAVKLYTDKHTLTEAQAMARFNLPAYMKQSITESLSIGVITSALVALFVQTKNKKS